MSTILDVGSALDRPHRRLAWKLFVISLPLVLVVGIDVCFLPFDHFTFRLWEALWTTQETATRYLLPGPFYPGVSLSKLEEFDLSAHEPNSARVPATWHTDSFGYRTRARPTPSYPVVIVGDSSTVGTGLDQRDTLAEVLERAIGQGVYPYAVSSVNRFLRDIRFVDHPPRTLVLAVTERMIRSIPDVPETVATMGEPERRLRRFMLGIQQTPWIQRVAIGVDRAIKLAPLRFARSRLAGDPPIRFLSPVRPGWVFTEGPGALGPVPDSVRGQCVRTLTGVRAALQARGIRFIFLPIPNKENIYFQLVPGESQPSFLSALIRDLRAAGLTVVDTQSAFNEACGVRGVQLYHAEDSHWTPAGVRLAAELLARQLNPSGLLHP